MKKLLSIIAIALFAVLPAMPCDLPEVSMVVAKQSFIGRTSALTATTLYTPASDGDYRVTAYLAFDNDMVISCGSTASVIWTDDFRANDVGVASASSNGHAADQLVLHVTAGNPIQVHATYGCNGGTITPYNLYVTVVRE